MSEMEHADPLPLEDDGLVWVEDQLPDGTYPERDCSVEKEWTTCFRCPDNATCQWAWDPYNTDGDCLASK
jgi:hypothetical protein